ncbi:hypothetical protein DITRI_Ditri02bG0088900 [Diplodiscus trichospermus]
MKKKSSMKDLQNSGGVAVIQAAVEEGIVVGIGGGCTLLRLAAKVDAIKETFENDKQRVGADIVKRALSYPMKLIAKNAGVNGIEKVFNYDGSFLVIIVSYSVVINLILFYLFSFGSYGCCPLTTPTMAIMLHASGKYKDLMEAGIIDPIKDIPSDAVVVEIKEPEPMAAGNPMDNSGYPRLSRLLFSGTCV